MIGYATSPPGHKLGGYFLGSEHADNLDDLSATIATGFEYAKHCNGWAISIGKSMHRSSGGGRRAIRQAGSDGVGFKVRDAGRARDLMFKGDPTAAHRAKYHPLDDVQVVLAHTATGKRTTAATKRCAVHGRLWESLSQHQQDAAEYVARCHGVTHGSLAPAVDLTRLIEPRSHKQVPAGIEQSMRNDYVRWQLECRKNQVDYRPAIYVFAEGGFIRDLSRAARKRHRIRGQISESLDVMAQLMGWKR